ncbi:pyridoxal phosphate-dependent transferase [Globomyces pollinis-pini]|nr:pyridoxal phosphate-dependent transferase [Globomyces pollinis-pini]
MSPVIPPLDQDDFPQLKNQIYLDNAGCVPVPKQIITGHTNDLLTNHYSNPHSQPLLNLKINHIRRKILSYLNTNDLDYSVIFTSNATAALKLLADSIDWNNKQFWYLDASHTSVVGISPKVAQFTNTPVETCTRCISESEISGLVREYKFQDKPVVFAYPAQCNFSGVKFSPSWINDFHTYGSGNAEVLIDIAAYSSTSAFDLSKYPADYAVLSFYKIFGFPTGLGALIVKNSCAKILKKNYTGGGTVSAISVAPLYISNRTNIHEKFEDGTLPFQQIIALEYGFTYIESRFGDWKNLSNHCNYLANLARSKMSSLKHDNGANLVEFYPNEWDELGPIVTFNLKSSDGSHIGYSEISKFTAIENIHLRVGRFCNPGASQFYLNLSSEDIKDMHQSHGFICGDGNDLLNGKPTGAIRISFGMANTEHDCLKWIEFLSSYFQEKNACLKTDTAHLLPSTRTLKLTQIIVYPIKSCSGYVVESWPLSETGLMYDRNFMLLDSNNHVLTQKNCILLKQIEIIDIDLSTGYITVSAPGMPSLVITSTRHGNSMDSLICLKPVTGLANDESVNQWFSEFLQQPCVLVSMESKLSFKTSSQTSFVNTSQFLLISNTSLDVLKEEIPNSSPKSHVSSGSFRANFIFDGETPFEEENWVDSTVQIGDIIFKVVDHCERCQMICTDDKGQRYREPLKTLAQKHKRKGKIIFGLHLQLLSDFSGKSIRINH